MLEDIASDVVTETTHVGFGQKLVGSIVGFIFGLLLLAASSNCPVIRTRLPACRILPRRT